MRKAIEDRLIPLDGGGIDERGDGGVGGVGHMRARRHPSRLRRRGPRPPTCPPCRSTARRRPPWCGRGRRRREWPSPWWPMRWGRGGSLRPGGPGRCRPCAGPASRCPGASGLPRGPLPDDAGGPLVGDPDGPDRAPVAQGGLVGHVEDGVGHQPRRRTPPGPEQGCRAGRARGAYGRHVASGRTMAARTPEVPTSTTRTLPPWLLMARVSVRRARAGRAWPGLRMPTGSRLFLIRDKDVEARAERLGQEAGAVEPDPVVVADGGSVASMAAVTVSQARR